MTLQRRHLAAIFDYESNVDFFSSQGTKETVLQWDHLPCYEFYELSVYKDGNETFVTKHTVEATKDDTLITFPIQDLQACTAYTFLINR